MSHSYCLGGLKVVSDIELPELMSWHGSLCEPAEELEFCVGRVPSALEKPDHVGSDFQTEGRHRFLLRLSDKGRILIEHGRKVIVEPGPGADLTDARAVLMGPVQAILWHQRGLLPLHASAISVSGRAVALAGPSGVGKSTLAAALSGKHSVLADDICIVDTSDRATMLPSTPRLRLWREALKHFDIPVTSLPRALSRREKYLIEGQWIGTEEQQLAAVILLSRGAGREVTIARLRGWTSFTGLQSVVHMLGAARSLGLNSAIFTALVKLIEAGVSVWDLSIPDDLVCIDKAGEKVLSVLDGCT